jgi:pimeloyl-ACP methyl ester carboxylesterase
MGRHPIDRGEDTLMRHLLGAATLLLAAGAIAPATARTLGSLEFEPCGLKSPGLPVNIDAQCTTLKVPEDPSKPDGRQIELAIAWVPSRADEALPDPVFMLAGGPGQSARETFPGAAGAFRDLRARRHIILVDQRGTGGSHRLSCTPTEAEMQPGAMESPAAMRAFAARCRDALQGQADLRFYGTSEAVADLDRVRAAIGAEQVNLVGVSYGTRVGLEYLRRFPQRTRTLVIDGVVPPELYLGNDHAKNLEAALAKQFERCAKDATCRERFGEPGRTLQDLFARLREAPVQVTARDPVTGVESTRAFGAAELTTVVRLFSYSPGMAAMLPLGLAEAAAGRFDTLLAQSRMVGEMMGETIALGMHFSVSCAEDADGLVADPADEGTTLGNGLIEGIKAACVEWPRGTVPADFHQPVNSEVPVLLLSGELDPVTPPRYGEMVLAGLPNGRHLVARGTGHNVMPAGCMPKLVSLFVQDANAKDLDATCLERLADTPPFGGFYGWEP